MQGVHVVCNAGGGGVTHHMLCTESGLKTCCLSPVCTLNPLCVCVCVCVCVWGGVHCTWSTLFSEETDKF